MGAEKLLGGKPRLALPLYYVTFNNVPVANSRRGLFGKKKTPQINTKTQKTNKQTKQMTSQQQNTFKLTKMNLFKRIRVRLTVNGKRQIEVKNLSEKNEQIKTVQKIYYG